MPSANISQWLTVIGSDSGSSVENPAERGGKHRCCSPTQLSTSSPCQYLSVIVLELQEVSIPLSFQLYLCSWGEIPFIRQPWLAIGKHELTTSLSGGETNWDSGIYGHEEGDFARSEIPLWHHWVANAWEKPFQIDNVVVMQGLIQYMIGLALLIFQVE